MKALQLALLFAAVLAGAGAHAQIYKWVDENGVTNYAGKPPADAAVKPDIVPEKISVYAQDPAVLRTLATASASRRDPVLEDRIDRLERALAAERRARRDLLMAEADASRAAREQCLAQRRVDCDGEGFSAYSPPVVPVFFHGRQKPFVPRVSLTGVTAGNVTAAIRGAGRSFNAEPEAKAATRAVRTGRGRLPG